MSFPLYNREFNNLALLDEEFLIALQEQKNRTLYARVTALDINELPIEYIQGYVQSGNINIDGSSSVRRTCNLTMVAEELDIQEVYWGVQSKIKLEIGLKNDLDDGYGVNGGKYPEIIWFPQGIYLLTNFTTSIQLKGYSISLSGKDKMCLLNGDLGGNLFASIDFGQEEEEEKKFSIVTITDANSEILVSQVYYVEVENDFPEEVFITSPANSMEYSFEKSGEGTYYKDGSYYKLITSNLNNFKPDKYKIYQKVKTPSDMFIEVPSMTTAIYQPNTFYYNPYQMTSDPENSFGYYVLDTGTSYSGGRKYWRLKTIYQIEYSISKTKIPLEKIIRSAVHEYAKEPYHNIIINDLDDYGLEQLTYKGETPILAIRRASDNEFYNLGFKDRVHYYYRYNNSSNNIHQLNGADESSDYGKLDEISEKGWFKWDSLNNIIPLQPTPFFKTLNDAQNNSSERYYLAEISYGDDIGYRITDLTYTGDLISSLGDSLTSVLDKIKEMLGEFEYFYDLNGHFVFQQKKNYVNISWSQIIDSGDEEYVTFGTDKSKFSFNFEGNRLITAIQNAPQLNNVRNDFSIWGKRKGLNGAEIPIHARYAIDKKPKEYMAFNGILYYTAEAKENPSPEYAELITGEVAEANTYEKDLNLIPSYLKNTNVETGEISSDWWELRDWAEYYRMKTGVYPSYMLMAYCEEGYTGNIHFTNQRTYHLNNRIVIDVDTSTAATGTDNFLPYTKTMVRSETWTTLNWNPFQHGYQGCFHTYREYLGLYDLNPDLRTFIYKPRLPEDEIIIIDGGNPYQNNTQEKPALEVDWRELIYRMAVDQHAAQGVDSDPNNKNPIYDKDHNLVLYDSDWFLSAVAERNPTYYPDGYTGYEQYYTDMLGFWRQLYDPDYLPQPVWKPGYYEVEKVQKTDSIYFQKVRKWHDESIEDFKIDYYFCPDENYIIKKQQTEYFGDQGICVDNVDLKNKYERYLIKSKSEYAETEVQNFELRYWNVKVIEAPETLNFWIDFLDDAFELANFSIPMIGDRSKTVNEDKIKAIAYRLVPGLVVVSQDKIEEATSRIEDELMNHDLDRAKAYVMAKGGNISSIQWTSEGISFTKSNGQESTATWKTMADFLGAKEEKDIWEQHEGAIIDQIRAQSGYNFVWLPKGMSKFFTISYRGHSAKDYIEQLLYDYGYCIENITITSIPLYHLEPNTRIYVKDETTNINGEYIINKISLPLDHRGTMTINATKAPTRIL